MINESDETQGASSAGLKQGDEFAQLKINIDPNLKRRFRVAIAKYCAASKTDNINQTTLLTAYIVDFCDAQGV